MNISTRCKNRKSAKEPTQQCTHQTIHGLYCGKHYRNPHPWVQSTPPSSPNTIVYVFPDSVIQHMQTLVRRYRLYKRRIHGVGYWNRTLCTNDSDFFSTDACVDISDCMFYSYMDNNNHVYGFDIRSIYSLIQRARIGAEIPVNPYTRAEFPSYVVKQIMHLVKELQRRNLPTLWEPLAPTTPEQQWRMQTVDLFSKIDELNYYSSPEWFINLSEHAQRRFYVELCAIWSNRAGLSIQQKNTIVPNYSRKVFLFNPLFLGGRPVEFIRQLNLSTINTLITSAVDRNDRILGAMYVISTLTIVHPQARTAYPWLYESVGGIIPLPAQNLIYANERLYGMGQILANGWLHDVFNIGQLHYDDTDEDA